MSSTSFPMMHGLFMYGEDTSCEDPYDTLNGFLVITQSRIKCAEKMILCSLLANGTFLSVAQLSSAASVMPETACVCLQRLIDIGIISLSFPGNDAANGPKLIVSIDWNALRISRRKHPHDVF